MKLKIFTGIFFLILVINSVFSRRDESKEDAVKVKITCTTLQSTKWSYLGDIQTCGTGEGLEILSQNSIVDNGSKDTSIIAVSFYSPSQVYYMPQGLLDNYPNLKGLYFHTQPLHTLRRRDLKQFGTHLEYLQIYKCQISFLTKNLFRYNTNMKYINFETNPMKYIEPRFFENLSKMKYLEQATFLDCSCIDLNIYKPKIQDAEFQHKCNDRAIEGLTSSIDIKCEYFDLNSDSQCKLYVDDEDSVIDSVVFTDQNTKETKTLTIRRGYTKFIPLNLGEKFPKLKELVIDSAGLVKISQKSLNVHLKNLELLNLASNILVKIPTDSFEFLVNLETLDLSHNYIQSFSSITVKNLSKLKFLYLSGNALKSISVDFFDVLPKTIETVYLGGNDCIDMQFPHHDKTEISNKIKEKCAVKAECLV